MARTTNITPDDSIQQNLDTWCFEVGGEYEAYSQLSADRFIQHIGKETVIDLGSGDGAATNYFAKNGNKVIAVDINTHKLAEIKTAWHVVKDDFVHYLSKPIKHHLFMHHALEHTIEYQKVLDLIGKNLAKGKYCYIAVPKDDEPHSVHHVAFDSPEEIIPTGLTLIESIAHDEPWKEYITITRK
jgi:SAM-dependent methyltransferase